MPIIPQSVTDALVSVNKMFEGKQAQDAANAQALNDVTRVRDARDIEGKWVGPKLDDAELIPVPPRADPWFGVRCEGAGAPGKRKDKCYRQAQMFRMSGTLTRGPDEPEPLTIREQEAQFKRRAASVYDGYISPEYAMSAAFRGLNPVAPGGMVSEPPKVPVCLYHSNAEQFDLPHPDDRPADWTPSVPEAPKPVTHTLDDLDPTLGLSVVSRDPNFVWLTDGKAIVIVTYEVLIEKFGRDWIMRMIFKK